MKKILSYILPGIFVLAASVSCQDEDQIRFPDFITGANARVVLYPDNSYINLADLQNSEIAFDVYSVNKNMDRLVYQVVFTDADSAEASFASVDAVVVTPGDFVAGKATRVSVSAEELVTALNLPGGLSYLEGGDFFTFTPRFITTSGEVITPANSAPSITTGANSSFTTQFTTFVGCPSPVTEITGKTYRAAIRTFNSANQAPFGLPNTSTENNVTITFVGPEPFRYRVSSSDAGWWARPDIVAIDAGTADFFDICGTIIMQPKASFCCGGLNDAGGGSYDPATGIIRMKWYNAANDIFGEIVYTPV